MKIDWECRVEERPGPNDARIFYFGEPYACPDCKDVRYSTFSFDHASVSMCLGCARSAGGCVYGYSNAAGEPIPITANDWIPRSRVTRILLMLWRIKCRARAWRNRS